MVYRISKNGFFLSCTGYPECDGTQPVDLQGKPTHPRSQSEYKCPICGREMIKRTRAFRRVPRMQRLLGQERRWHAGCTTIINLDKEGKPLPPKVNDQDDREMREVWQPDAPARQQAWPVPGLLQLPECRSTKMVEEADRRRSQAGRSAASAVEGGCEKAREMAAKITGEIPASAGNGKTGPITTDIDCDECGKPMIIRSGRRGKFLGCSGYPKCNNTGEVPASLIEELGLNGDGKAVEVVPPAEPDSDVVETDLEVT